jgi:hypothetical protein
LWKTTATGEGIATYALNRRKRLDIFLHAGFSTAGIAGACKKSPTKQAQRWENRKRRQLTGGVMRKKKEKKLLLLIFSFSAEKRRLRIAAIERKRPER